MMRLLETGFLACSVCFKDPDSIYTLGLNKAIIALLAVLIVVLGLIIKFLFSFNKRARMSEDRI